MTKQQRGVTLMELLVVVTIIGILAAIAIPSYRRYVVRANRTDAKTQLLQTAQALERCYSTSTPYAYNSAVCNAAVTFPITTPGGWYQITRPVSVPLGDALGYTLLATPQGTQLTDDTACGSFQITQAGVMSITGTGTVAECWRK
jgi:type IV pilus assembly protein PilE